MDVSYLFGGNLGCSFAVDGRWTDHPLRRILLTKKQERNLTMSTSLLLPHEAILRSCLTPSLIGAIPILPIMLAAASSWFVPTIIASSEHEVVSSDDEAETDVDYDDESTIVEESILENEMIDEELNDLNEEKEHVYDPIGLQIWKSGECVFGTQKITSSTLTAFLIQLYFLTTWLSSIHYILSFFM